MKNLRNILASVSSGMRRCVIAAAIVQTAMIFALLFWLAALPGFPRRESVCFAWGVIVLAASLAWMLFRISRAILHKPTPEQLAAVIEEKCPEYMDSFATAVELEALQRPLRPIESSLLAEVYERVGQESSSFLRLFSNYGIKAYLFRLVLAALIFLAGIYSGGWRGFTGACRGIILGDCGIVVIAPQPDVPLHSDYRLSVQLRRGTHSGTIHWRSADGTDASFPLNADEQGNLFFTFYDMTQDVAYHIETPELCSDTQIITVYEPPVYEEMTLEVTPPDYSKLKKKVYHEPGTVELLEGSRLSIAVKCRPEISAALHQGMSPSAVMPFSNGTSLSIVPKADEQLRIHLQDRQGHISEYPIHCVLNRDMPPEITRISPADDATIKPGDSLRLDISVVDDFGLESLVLDYAVSGGEHRQSILKKCDGEKEWDFSFMWKPMELSLKEGNLLCCQLLATDNREPVPNTARSQLFFVTVRPDAASMEAEAGNLSSQKEASLADLIAEAKRLLRLTWDINNMQQHDKLGELAECLATLKSEIIARKEQMKKMAGGDLGEAENLFHQAAEKLQFASGIASRGLVEETIAPQEKALAILVAIETAMIRNTMKSKAASQQSQGGDGSSQQQQQPEEKSDKGEAADELKLIKEALKALKQLVAEQNEINIDIENRDKGKATLANRQAKVLDTVNQQKQNLASNKRTMPVSAALNVVSGDMGGARRALEANALENALHYGHRALNGLRKALDYLQELMNHAAADEMQKLVRDAEELKNQQRQAAQSSQEKNAPSSQLRQEQKKLQEKTESLLKEMGSFSDRIQDEYPQAALKMRQAVSNSAQELQEMQTRAQKALAYKRMNRAADEQNRAADKLEKLTSALKEAEQSMQSLSEGQLRQALQELAEQLQKLQQAENDKNQESAREKIEQAHSSAAKTLSRFGKSNEKLRQTAGELSAALPQDNQKALQLTRQQIASAALSIAQALDKMMQLQQHAQPHYSAPPEKYRRQVEQYFKDISQIQPSSKR